MKIFEIVDGEINRDIGVLLYYEKKRDFIIELMEDLDEWTAPLLFTNLVKNKDFTVPRKLACVWVRERIIPSGRQNISMILKNHKMESYDEMKLLEASKGRCSQDSMYVKRLDDLPEYVKERRKKNITECVTCEGEALLCFFENSVIKKVSLRHLEKEEGVAKVLKNHMLYQSCKVGTGGYCVTFDEAIDIPASKLYEKGETIPLSPDDFLRFAKNNLLDTTDCYKILECSRQNVAYMVKRKQLNPVKEDVKGALYLKGEVDKNSW